MAEERTVRREVEQETVAPAAAPVVKETTQTTQTTRTVQPAAVAPSGVTNVNVTPATATTEEGGTTTTGGNVTINTPEGTQVNVGG